MNAQDEIFEFLSDPASYPTPPAAIELMETHGALIFLVGDDVYKLKRAVTFSYMDFGTPELRRRAVLREIEINRPHAPDIYIDAIPITRGSDGRLRLGGDGEPIDWVVHMKRFAQKDLLSAVAARGELDAGLARAVADMVFDYHNSLPPVLLDEPLQSIEPTLRGLMESLASQGHIFGEDDIARLQMRAFEVLGDNSALIAQRVSRGFIRRCHGDLHLGNIVMLASRPVPFDAIEFDERIGTIDVLYDLAFLLMDLEHRGHRAEANLILNRYLSRQNEIAHFKGLALLPLYLATRAIVRAVVGVHRAETAGAAKGAATQVARDIEAARKYFARALSYLEPEPARLVAVGGLSGTGKSTIAAKLAPGIGAAPGAINLRSDLERKALFGVGETDRLPAECYRPETSATVYAILHAKAKAALKAGHSVIVDAVCAKPDERAALEALATETGVAFAGLWLEADEKVLLARVGARTGDASDAGPAVVEQQLGYDLGAITWNRIDANGAPEEALQLALEVLSL